MVKYEAGELGINENIGGRTVLGIKKKTLLVLCGILLLTGILISGLWYTNTRKIVNVHLATTSDFIMQDAFDAFDYLLKDTEYMLTLITLNKDNIIEPLNNVSKVRLNKYGQLDYQYLENQRIINEFIRSMNGYKYYIVGINVASVNGYIFRTSHVVQNYDELYDMILQIDQEEVTRSMVLMDPVSTDSTWINLHSDYVIPAVRAVLNSSNQIVGYTILYFDYSVIETMFAGNLPEGSKFYVTNKNGHVVFSNFEDGTFDFSEKSSDYVYSEYTDEKVDWTFHMAIPSRQIISELNKSALQTGIAMLLIFSVAVIGCTVFISGLVDKIKRLNATMGQVAQGNLDVHETITGHDEIGQIQKTFNYMLDEIKLLMKQIRQKEEQKQKLEMDFLQAQINPHFISNTLNVVAWMGKMYQADNIVRLTESLSALLRSVMKQTDTMIELRQEVSYLEIYLHTMEYSGSLDVEVEYDIGEDTKHLFIPKFILQPIVENAIYHGLQDEPDNNGVIRIRSEIVDDELQIVVEDNGSGMDEAMIGRLLSEPTAPEKGFNKVGVYNVISRIQLLFGEQYGLKYESEIGKYTRVYFNLPIMFEPDKEKENG